MPPTSQRLVPIRPSPLKGLSSQSSNVISNVNSSTITPMKTGAKRKLVDDMAIQANKNKKHNTGGTGNKSTSQVTSMGRRNARERNRVKQVNNSFLTLRQHIPGASKAKKVSKVETLKQAVDYIRNLQRLLEDHDAMNGADENSYNANPNIMASPENTPVSNPVSVYSPNIQEQCSPQQTQISPRQVCQQPQTTPVLRNSQTQSFQNYYYAEDISPVSPTSYPMNVRNQVNKDVVFKQEIDITHQTELGNYSNSQITPTYSNCPTPLTPASQTTFTLTPMQSSGYSVSTTIYPTTLTYSPNSIAEPSPTEAYSPPSMPLSPNQSPPNIITSVPEYGSTFPSFYEDVKPSLIEAAQNFTLPAIDIPYDLPNEIPPIDMDKLQSAMASSNHDLDLLDAIACWQQE